MAMPQDTAATPQSIDPGSVIASAVSIYKDHAGVLIGAALVVFAVEAVLVFLLGPVGAILSLIASTFFQGMVVELVRDVQDGRRDSSVGDLFRSVAPVVLPLLGVSILAGIGITIGLVLLIVPGLYLITIWSVVAPVVVVERPGVFPAFNRSRELVRGYGWQVFGVIVVVILIALVVVFLVAIITSNMGDGGRAAVQWALNVLTAPLSALLVSVLYFGLLRVHGGGGSPAMATAGPEVPGTWSPPTASEAPTTVEPAAAEPPTQQQPAPPPRPPASSEEPPPSTEAPRRTSEEPPSSGEAPRPSGEEPPPSSSPPPSAS